MCYGFTDPDLQVIPAPKDDAEWHSRRAFCIGGSDVGAIMGLNEHKTPLQVYREKVDHIVPDLSDNPYIKKGKMLESVIFENWVVPKMKLLGYNAIHTDEIFSNNRTPYIQCNLDGIAVSALDPSCIIEIKWVSAWGAANWNGDEYGGIPKSYYAQVQTYMAVTGAPKAYVFALFDDDWNCEMYTIPRDEGFITKLLYAAKTFYEVHMQMEVPPKPLYGKDVAEEVSATLETAPAAHTSEAFTDLVCEYLQKQHDAKDLAAQVDDLKQQIFERYAQGERSLLPTVHVYVKTCDTTRFDTTAFRKAYPELYSQFTVTSKTNRFMVNKK